MNENICKHCGFLKEDHDSLSFKCPRITENGLNLGYIGPSEFVPITLGIENEKTKEFFNVDQGE